MIDLVSNLISYKAHNMTMAASDLVVARKLSTVLVALLYLCTSVKVEANFTVWTTRRITSDIYKLNLEPAHSTCTLGSKGTYLVSEKKCVSDEELQNSM